MLNHLQIISIFCSIVVARYEWVSDKKKRKQNRDFFLYAKKILKRLFCLAKKC